MFRNKKNNEIELDLSHQQIKIYGVENVKKAILAKENIYQVAISENIHTDKIKELTSLCQEFNINYIHKSESEIAQWQYPLHEGVRAVVRGDYLQLESINDLFEKVHCTKPYLFVILDSIESPGNFGAILRSCNLLRVTAVITTKDRFAKKGSLLTYKASSQTLPYVPHIEVNNLQQIIQQLKQLDVWLYGMDIQGTDAIWSQEFNRNTAIVMGAESQGMRQLTRKSCDFLIHIPTEGHADSFNVSVATGIILYEIRRQQIKVKSNSVC